MPFDAVKAVAELSAKLAARNRHVSLFLGAGASMTAGLPSLSQMNDAVLQRLSEASRESATALFATRNIEQVLTRLRRISAIADDGATVGDFNRSSATALDREICAAIVDVVSRPKGDLAAFQSLGIWAAGSRYALPVEIFTVNYDTLIETGMELEAAAYFDGFVGALRGQFREDLVEEVDPMKSESLPASFARLWKLHGSINWTFHEEEGGRSVVRLGRPVDSGIPAAIYPSDEKYDDSRRVPFVVLMDRFRHALATPESITIVSGYSFSDQHLNDMLFDAAKRYPRSEILVGCFGDIPLSLSSRAELMHNVLVFGGSEGIIGGVRSQWQNGEPVPNVFDGEQLLLADFRNLARFLAGSRGRTVDDAAA